MRIVRLPIVAMLSAVGLSMIAVLVLLPTRGVDTQPPVCWAIGGYEVPCGQAPAWGSAAVILLLGALVASRIRHGEEVRRGREHRAAPTARSAGGEGDCRSDRSRSLTVAAALIASIASATTIAYLDPQSSGTVWLIAAGLVVVWVPLLGHFPLSTARLAVASGVWFTVGIPGAYFFGALVAYAGALMGLLLVLHALAARVRGRGSRSPSSA